jgi:DeoR/GlpR family transcriptional regulator of sugar metabolism
MLEATELAVLSCGVQAQSVMGVNRVLAVDRRHRLLERVAEEQSVHVAEFAREFGVSEMTIRRDVARLERDGFIKQTYGGATAHLTRSLELAFNARALQHSREKRLIGMATATLLSDVTSMFVGVGTTAEQFARFLPSRRDLTVITESIPVASLLGSRALNVVILGGAIRQDELCCIGPAATATLAQFHADVAVIGAAGLSASRGLMEFHQEEAENHRLMMERSERVIVVADGSKVGQRAMVEVAPADHITTLITDHSASRGDIDDLREIGIDVLMAGAEATAERR